MKYVVSRFPLLRLPNKAMLNTLRMMKHLEIFGISVLSKKIKRSVERLKFTVLEFQVSVEDIFDVVLRFTSHDSLHFEHYQAWENEPLQELGTPRNLNIRYGGTRKAWENLMSSKQLLDHLQSIFNSPTTVIYFGPECGRFCLDSIYRHVKNVGSIVISNSNHEYSSRVLSLFHTPVLSIMDTALVNGCVPKDVLIQNFDVIHVHKVHITLDELLMTNSRAIQMNCRSMSMKVLNQFLKLWMKGCNPRLEYVDLEFSDNSLFEELFCELNHREAPPCRNRYFGTAGKECTLVVAEGWDIWRIDGTQATITVLKIRDSVYFQFFVWHHHCLVR